MSHFSFALSDEEAALIRAALNSKLTVLNNLALNVRSRDQRADHSAQASATAAILKRLDEAIVKRTQARTEANRQALLLKKGTPQ